MSCRVITDSLDVMRFRQPCGLAHSKLTSLLLTPCASLPILAASRRRAGRSPASMGGVIVDDETVTGMNQNQWQEPQFGAPVNEHDQVGTVEVQILLSWFFETSTPGEVSTDLPRAA